MTLKPKTNENSHPNDENIHGNALDTERNALLVFLLGLAATSVNGRVVAAVDGWGCQGKSSPLVWSFKAGAVECAALGNFSAPSLFDEREEAPCRKTEPPQSS